MPDQTSSPTLPPRGEPSPPTGQGDPSASASEVLEAVLTELAHTAGLEPGHGTVRGALQDARRHDPGSLEDTWSRHLQHAGLALGLTLTLLRRPLEEVLREGGHQGPLATVSFSEQGARWLLIDEWETGRMHVHTNLRSEG